MAKKYPPRLLRQALILEYVTIAWNIVEGIACMVVGLFNGSVALFAYGLESSIEVFASAVVIWELKGADHDREEIALKLIGYAYLVVSAYVLFDSVKSIIENHHPDKSPLSLLMLAFIAAGMTILGLGKRRVGKLMKSSTVLADAKFTLIDAALSITVLIGLAFNIFLGWWWMDQVMAIFLAGVAFREGLKEVL